MNRKVCTKCKEEKDITEYHKSARKKDGRNSHCKACQSARYYADQPNQYKRIRAGIKRRQTDGRAFILQYLLDHPCIHCGETRPWVLEFDHLSNKKMPLSEMVGQGYHIDALTHEINKCQVLCANCHREKTAKEQGWYCYIPS